MAKKRDYEKWYKAERSLWFDFECPDCKTNQMIRLRDAEKFVFCFSCRQHADRVTACDAGRLKVVRNKARIREWVEMMTGMAKRPA